MMVAEKHKVFVQDEFLDAFATDLQSARGLVIIQSPFVTVRRIERIRSVLSSCIRRKVRVCAFIQRPGRHPGTESADERNEQTAAAVKMLVSCGVHVTARARIHEKLAVIDETVFWEGSLNILSHASTFERMTRWVSRKKVQEALGTHKLNMCGICCADSGIGINEMDDAWVARQRQVLGAEIAKRRQLLEMSQAVLAERSGVDQPSISEIETGTRDVRISTLLRLGRELRSGLRLLDWYLLPSHDDDSSM